VQISNSAVNAGIVGGGSGAAEGTAEGNSANLEPARIKCPDTFNARNGVPFVASITIGAILLGIATLVLLLAKSLPLTAALAVAGIAFLVMLLRNPAHWHKRIAGVVLLGFVGWRGAWILTAIVSYRGETLLGFDLQVGQSAPWIVDCILLVAAVAVYWIGEHYASKGR
jgi:hypothetical protein